MYCFNLTAIATRAQLSNRYTIQSQPTERNYGKKPNQSANPSLKTFDDRKIGLIATIGSFHDMIDEEHKKDHQKSV